MNRVLFTLLFLFSIISLAQTCGLELNTGSYSCSIEFQDGDKTPGTLNISGEDFTYTSSGCSVDGAVSVLGSFIFFNSDSDISCLIGAENSANEVTLDECEYSNECDFVCETSVVPFPTVMCAFGNNNANNTNSNTNSKTNTNNSNSDDSSSASILCFGFIAIAAMLLF